ncbi:MAG: LPXTG cell wall anchor domain-containing protein [Ruminococcus sp.]|nr:LPXTG cell wall anchor domain-containing protein [Ruminococcus sp.]
MKHSKKFAAMMAALALTACSIAPMFVMNASATEVKTGSISISKAEAGHTFTAYQIFSGSIDKDGSAVTFGQVVWGTGIDDEKTFDVTVDGTVVARNIYAALKALDITVEVEKEGGTKENVKPFDFNFDDETPETAADVAKGLELIQSNANKNTRTDIDKVAEVFAKYKKGNGTPATAPTTEGGDYTFTDLDAGYYLVTDSTTSGAETTQLSKYMLQVAAGEVVDVAVKSDAPKVMKKVFEDTKTQSDTVSFDGKNIDLGTGFNDAADYDMNQVFEFNLYGSLPSNYEVYEGYSYEFVDTYDKGISLVDTNKTVEGIDATDFTITVGNTVIPAVGANDTVNYTYTALTKDADEVTGDREAGFKLTFADLKDIVDADGNAITLTADSVIKVSYNAILNADAVIGNPGNENDVFLKYSKNPYNGGAGTEKPKEKEEDKGKTPKDTNVVFTYKIDSTKYLNEIKAGNEAGENEAGFVLKKVITNDDDTTTTLYANVDSSNKILGWATEDDAFNKDEDGKITTPKDGFEVKTADKGKFGFTGLQDGTYTLVETTVPTGYNKMDDLTIKVTAVTNNEAANTCQNYLETEGTDTGKVLTKLQVEVNGETTDGNATEIKNEQNEVLVGTQGQVDLSILNQKGSTLPSTGGIGTTIFYLGGGAMVAVAGVFLITKKRMGKREN